MSRKTHPISHRLGVTVWWKSRTPPGTDRYVKIAKLVEGIMTKYGYKMSEIYASQPTKPASEEPGRLIIVVSKVIVTDQTATNPTPTAPYEVTAYIAEYVRTLLRWYEKVEYQVDLREIIAVPAQGTARIIGKTIVQSDRSLIPTMQAMERQVRKAQT